MKLHQNLQISNDGKIKSFLSGENTEYEYLSGNHDFSFYPYILRAVAENNMVFSCAPKVFDTLIFNIDIREASEEKAVFAGLNNNRALLLISELTSSIREALDALDFEFLRLSIKNGHLELTINSNKTKSEKIYIGAVMILICSIDMLLFVRGLIIKNINIDQNNNNLILLDKLANNYV